MPRPLSCLILLLAAPLAPAATPISVQVDPAIVYQQMQGFGASLTDSSAWVLNHDMTAVQRNSLMSALFSPTTGIGISFLRQPIGASDFATSNYTYDDVAAGQNDYALTQFSIARDESTTIPLLQQAKSLNPAIRLMATPWSPPAWMKTTGQINGGHLKDSDAVYTTYANYFVKYIQAYQSHGLTIDYLSLQNEPWFEATYPSMGMDPPEAARLLKFVGPKLQQNNIATKILAWDHNWDNAKWFVPSLLADTQAAQYVDGIAFHGYAGDVSAQTDIHNQFPDKGTFFTELTSTLANTNFAGDLIWDMKNLIVGGARNWDSSIVRWNLALDQTGGPHLTGGADNCRGMVTVNSATGAVSFNLEYYSLGHISKFVQPGAYHVFSDADASAAFVNPDGSTALITYNDASSSRTFSIRWQGRTLTYVLPGMSVATFSWNDPRNVGVWLTTGDKTRLLARQTDITLSAVTPSAWVVNFDTTWNDSANWSDGTPNYIDADARFTTGAASPRTISLNTPVIAGAIHFDNPAAYALGGPSTLTMQVSSGSTLIEADKGSHRINVPITFASSGNINVYSGATLVISSPVTVAAGKKINDSAGITTPGSLTYLSTITLQSGAGITFGSSQHLTGLTLGPAASASLKPRSIGGAKLLLLDTLSTSAGSTLDLADNAVTIHYTSVAEAANLLAMLRSTYHRGAWDGTSTTGGIITSSSAAANPDHTTGLGYADNGGTLLIQYTWYGDANLDGTVDGSDAALMTIGAANATWRQGDFNYDGRVSPDDFAILNLGLALRAPTLTSPIPEPLSVATLLAISPFLLPGRHAKTRPNPVRKNIRSVS